MKLTRQHLYFLPAVVYCGLIFFLSTRDLKLKLGLLFWDKGAHSLEFAGLGFLLALGFFNNFSELKFLRVYLTILTGLAIGVLDEIHQMFVPGRQCDWKDWLADALGLLAGLIAFWLIYDWKQKRAGQHNQPAA
ncbi:MAG: VanZ family protein [Candidatus Saccharicenans sp.]|nr:VanZ family protein [Candidatus Saccharicenans sp.]